MYSLESELVSDFAKQLPLFDCLFTPLRIAYEFDYQSGRVDVIGATESDDLICFEAKLNRWRDAVHQAYRNTAFSDYSYVVLPEKTAKKAAMFWHEFDMRGVGLCVTTPEEIRVEIPAIRQTPLMPWLTKRAIQYIYNGKLIYNRNTEQLCQPHLLYT